ncbi:glycerophosphodiester phosphodiesterase family protein [Flavobacterium paronense]|uniref:Glycerophosphodiester phosphodiesterase n=1 Tax=Flavobacterium paronense TaxID=1392775 RepID=A0ABV5GF98_9FLAO|nr:glycerophosphodiester phosphodiesterase family protein [Flavobacterium paronense]MDN3678108.1 glycerophosphodiester phosphodiesterase family protein [Flavobacterium paronense]
MHKIGHRGAKGYVAENTLDSFQKAIELGVDGIELDVHLSLDEKVMVIHDDTIDRTTLGKGFVKDISSSELETFGIPTLEAVFELVNRNCFINVELKTYETADKVVEIIEKYVAEKHWKYEHFIVSSFDWNALQQVVFLNDKIRIGILTESDLDLALAFAKFIKAYSVHPYYQLLTEENVNQMQSKNFKVYPWTINEQEAIIFVKSLNVDGIISDFPDRL